MYCARLRKGGAGVEKVQRMRPSLPIPIPIAASLCALGLALRARRAALSGGSPRTRRTARIASCVDAYGVTHMPLAFGEAAQAVGRRPSLSNLGPELSGGHARGASISYSERWKTDWIGDWNKWSSGERMLALLVASLLLAVPLGNLLLAIQ
jgi:hypothetical protein